MAGPSHQTLRITRGRHGAPENGACVMELTSMLAGEPFSDRPQCVDPVIAAYMRALNDRLHHHDRQRLVPYAAAVVGTARAGATRACRDLCLRFASGSAALPQLRLLPRLGLHAALHSGEGAAEWAARKVVACDDLDAGLRLLDSLLAAAGAKPPLEAPPLPLAVRRLAQVG